MQVWKFETLVDCDVALLALVRNLDGNNSTAANISKIEVEIKNENGEATLAKVQLTPLANHLKSPLVTNDGRWQPDVYGNFPGYNFEYYAPGSAFASPGTYRIVFTFTETNGRKHKTIFEGAVSSE